MEGWRDGGREREMDRSTCIITNFPFIENCFH